MSRFTLPVMLCLALGLSAGCSGGEAVGTVTGQVTLDGQPMKKGLIRFVPADGKSSGVGADVVDGKYTAQVPVGEVKVEITADRVVGKQKMYDTPDSPTVDKVVPAVAERFNVATELRMTVQAGSQEKSFEVMGK